MANEGFRRDGSAFDRGSPSLEELRAGRKRHAEDEVPLDESEIDDEEASPRNVSRTHHSPAVNFISSDTSGAASRGFSLAAPRLLASASFTIESHMSGASSIAQSGFGMSSSKRLAVEVESQMPVGVGSGEASEAARGNAFGAAIANSDGRLHRQTQPMNPFLQSLSGTTSQLEKSPDVADGSSFVFGRDMSGRVTNTPTVAHSEQAVSEETRTDDVSSNAHSPSNDTNSTALWTHSSPGLSDGNAVLSDGNAVLSDGNAVSSSSTSPPVFKTPEKINLKTGEENDQNVLQVHCGLHVFDSKTHTWCERGRGLLRLNDMQHPNDDGTFQSRLVMRTDGSFRLTLNTLLWPQMVCEQAGHRSIRITALDSSQQGIRVFLITCAAKDVQPLHSAIDRRISALKHRHAVLTAQASTVDLEEDSDRGGDRYHHGETSGESDLSEADSEVTRSDLLSRERIDNTAKFAKGDND